MNHKIAELVSVTKIYERHGNGTGALKNVDFEIHSGEFVLLLGPSGSGKTTLLTLMAGFQKPSSGSVYLFGRNILEYTVKELQHIRASRIGFIFQTFNLIESLTVTENIKLVMKFSGDGRKYLHKRVYSLLNEFDIGHLKDSYPNTLSQGEKQRVAVVRALANDAELIIADEPTGSLSTTQGMQIVASLKDNAENKNRTVVMVSHDERMKEYASRILYLQDGKIGQ